MNSHLYPFAAGAVRHVLLPALAALLVSPVIVSAAGKPATPPAPATAAAPAKVDPARPETQLVKGMSAAEVKKIMGNPKETKPLAAPQGKAEIWSYVREVETRSNQVQVGSKPITMTQMGGDGKMHTTTIAEEPIFKMRTVTIEEQVDLLLFNDHFLEKRVARSARERFQG